MLILKLAVIKIFAKISEKIPLKGLCRGTFPKLFQGIGSTEHLSIVSYVDRENVPKRI